MAFNLEKINKRFRKTAEIVLKFRWFFLVLLVLLNGIALVGIQKVELESSWKSWFFDDDPVKIATDRFEEVFGNSDNAAILVEADDVFSPVMFKMLRDLGTEIEAKVPFVDKVISLSEFEFSRGTKEGMIVGNLVPDKIPADKKSIEKLRSLAFAKKNLVNKLFSDDSKETWVTVRLKDYPEKMADGRDPAYVVGEKISEVLAQKKYSSFNLKAAGMPMVTYDKMNYFKKEAGRIIMLAFIAAFFVLIISLRSFTGVVVPMVTTISSILVSYGGMGLLGIKIDASMMTVPIYLGLAVSIGYSIHIFNFFKRKFAETGDRKESVLYSLEHTGWPLFFTALTTVGCMLSFNYIDITSVQWIGNTSASILVVVYIFVMILTPVLLSFGKNREPQEKYAEDHLLRTDKFFDGLGKWVLGNAKPIVLFSLVIVFFLSFGLTKLRVDFEPFNTIGLKVPYVQKLYDIVQSKTGSMYSYNLTVEFNENGKAKEPSMLKKLEEVESKIKQLPLTKNTMSILDILKDMNRTMHGGNEEYFTLPETRNLVSQYLLLYENSGGKDAEYWMDYDYRILRLSVAVNDFRAAEVEKELACIQGLVEETFPGAKFGMIGTCIEGAIITNYIARGQVSSFLIALLVIGLLMIIVFRSVKAGLIGLVPNLIPVVVIGGLMGYFNIPLDMISMTIMPMLMGIAVDDSIHFINHVKLEVEKGNSYEKAIHLTFKTVGKALFMTSLILVITFSMYMTSVVRTYIVIGSLVGLGLISALLADYLLTPVLVRWAKPFSLGVVELGDDEFVSVMELDEAGVES